MQNSTLARRYAVALGELAKERGALDQVEADMASIRDICASSEFMLLITDEKTSREAKERSLRQLFEGKAHPITLNFLLLVVHKARSAYLPAMTEEFQHYADDVRNIVAVSVTTAAPLEQGQREKLQRKLAEVVGRGVRLVERIDPHMLGGVKVQIGDKVIDGSILGRLRRLKTAIKAARMTGKTAEV